MDDGSLTASLPALPEGAIAWIVGGIVAGVLIAALLLRLGTRLVAGFYPAFSQALSALISAQLASWVVTVLYRWAMGISDNSQDFKDTIPVYCAGILSQIVTYSLALREPGRKSITMIQATALSAPQIVLAICFLSGTFGSSSKLPTIAEMQKRIEDARNLLPSASSVRTAPSAAAIENSRREALRRHPGLGIAGSPMNVAFLERYRRYQKERPDYFLDPTWPMRLADETASELRSR